MRCYSRMLIFNFHKSVIVMDSIDKRFSRNVFEAVQKTRSTCFVGSKTTPGTLLLVIETLLQTLQFSPGLQSPTRSFESMAAR